VTLPEHVFKILRAVEWDTLCQAKTFSGSADDLRDGFIHLSTSEQLQGTLDKHFAGERELIVVELSGRGLGPALKLELSRGGLRFPHLYRPLDMSDVVKHWTLAEFQRIE